MRQTTHPPGNCLQVHFFSLMGGWAAAGAHHLLPGGWASPLIFPPSPEHKRSKVALKTKRAPTCPKSKPCHPRNMLTYKSHTQTAITSASAPVPKKPENSTLETQSWKSSIRTNMHHLAHDGRSLQSRLWSWVFLAIRTTVIRVDGEPSSQTLNLKNPKSK